MSPSELVRRYPWTFAWGTAIAYGVLAARVLESLS